MPTLLVWFSSQERLFLSPAVPRPGEMIHWLRGSTALTEGLSQSPVPTTSECWESIPGPLQEEQMTPTDSCLNTRLPAGVAVCETVEPSRSGVWLMEVATEGGLRCGLAQTPAASISWPLCFSHHDSLSPLSAGVLPTFKKNN